MQSGGTPKQFPDCIRATLAKEHYERQRSMIFGPSEITPYVGLVHSGPPPEPAPPAHRNSALRSPDAKHRTRRSTSRLHDRGSPSRRREGKGITLVMREL